MNTHPMNFRGPRDQKVMELFEYFECHNPLALLLSLLERHYRSAVDQNKQILSICS